MILCMAKSKYPERDRYQRPHDLLDNIPGLETMDGRTLDATARRIAEAISKGDRLKTNQLRNAYASIEALRTHFKRKKTFTDEMRDELYLLKPKLAYAAGRQAAVASTLFPFLSDRIDDLVDSQQPDVAARKFFALVESVVGYHRYFENTKA